MMSVLACSVWFTKENEHPGLLPLVLYFLNRYAALYWLVLPPQILRPMLGWVAGCGQYGGLLAPAKNNFVPGGYAHPLLITA